MLALNPTLDWSEVKDRFSEDKRLRSWTNHYSLHAPCAKDLEFLNPRQRQPPSLTYMTAPLEL